MMDQRTPTGRSKIHPRAIAEYFRRLLVLSGGKPPVASGVRFGFVGLLGMGIDFSICSLLVAAGMVLGQAHILSFLAATIFNYLLNLRWAFAGRQANKGFAASWRQRSAFLVMALMAIFLRGGVLATFNQLLEWPAPAPLLAAVGSAAVITFLGSFFFVIPSQTDGLTQALRWRVLAAGVVGYLLLLRLFYLGIPELVPEEAYYWNYAQHLDFGYLDHPPMVAWLIWLGTSLLGDTEVAIRLGAFLSWLVTAFFCFRLTRDLIDSSAALRAILLLSVLPFFFGVGFLMTPDAPLVTCWAGMLYFLTGALVKERQSAWWGVGLCAGLGMLSKYTIGLLIPATVLFMLIDRPSRRWFLRPQPYGAALLTALLFFPVIIWNAQHDWVSFTFQGPRRFQESLEFTLPSLLGSVLLLLTPTGAAAVLSVVLSRVGVRAQGTEVDAAMDKRSHLFAVLFTLVPFLFFLVFSLARNTKLNWTGPVWLAALPFVAWQMIPAETLRLNRLSRSLQRLWSPTIVATVLFLGFALHFWALGLPGLPYPQGTPILGWKDLAKQIERVEDEVESATRNEPLLVGMDKVNIASEMAFYRKRQAVGPGGLYEAVTYTTGCQLFGMESLMYRYWASGPLQDKLREKDPTLILIAHKLHELKDERIASSGWKIGRVNEINVRRNGKPVGRYYYTLAKRKGIANGQAGLGIDALSPIFR